MGNCSILPLGFCGIKTSHDVAKATHFKVYINEVKDNILKYLLIVGNAISGTIVAVLKGIWDVRAKRNLS